MQMIRFRVGLNSITIHEYIKVDVHLSSSHDRISFNSGDFANLCKFYERFCKRRESKVGGGRRNHFAADKRKC